MDVDVKAAGAMLAAVRTACEGGGASRALAVGGVHLPDAESLQRLGGDYAAVLGCGVVDRPVREALALGFLAGLAAPRRRPGVVDDVTSFLMDRDLVVRAAGGESVLRLPWFEEELFVGRQLPDIAEIPANVRSLAVRSYTTALGGEPTRYVFVSYGHAFVVHAVPVRDEVGEVASVLAMATPCRASGTWAGRSAGAAGQGGDPLMAFAEEHADARRQAAAAVATLTAREVEVLTLASRGCSYSEIAERLVLTAATVKTHLSHCYSKLQVRDKAHAVAVAMRAGVIQ